MQKMTKTGDPSKIRVLDHPKIDDFGTFLIKNSGIWGILRVFRHTFDMDPKIGVLAILGVSDEICQKAYYRHCGEGVQKRKNVKMRGSRHSVCSRLFGENVQKWQKTRFLPKMGLK